MAQIPNIWDQYGCLIQAVLTWSEALSTRGKFQEQHLVFLTENPSLASLVCQKSYMTRLSSQAGGISQRN